MNNKPKINILVCILECCESSLLDFGGAEKCCKPGNSLHQRTGHINRQCISKAVVTVRKKNIDMSRYSDPSSSHSTLTTRICAESVLTPQFPWVYFNILGDSRFRIKNEGGGRRLSCVPIVALRGAICSRPSLWGEY